MLHVKFFYIYTKQNILMEKVVHGEIGDQEELTIITNVRKSNLQTSKITLKTNRQLDL